LTTGNGRPLAPCNVAFRNPERALLSVDLFLFSSYFDPWVRSAPFPLFKRVILAPVCGRAYSRSTTLYFPTQKINGRIVGGHVGFSLSAFMPNLATRQSDEEYSMCFSLNHKQLRRAPIAKVDRCHPQLLALSRVHSNAIWHLFRLSRPNCGPHHVF
jgi:hypothetical protein